MTINRTHLAGLLLVQQQVSITNPLAAEQLEYLIAKAQAAPEAEPYGYLREVDGNVQLSIGPVRPADRSGGFATPWAAIFAAPQHDAELVELLDDLASALECEVNARYAGSQTHPALARKYEGDMDEVRRARAKLATLRHV